MRDLTKLIEIIKKEVPENFEKRNDLFYALDDRADSYLYTAPEIIPERFGEVAEILNDYLGSPDIEWKQKIADIFNNA